MTDDEIRLNYQLTREGRAQARMIDRLTTGINAPEEPVRAMYRPILVLIGAASARRNEKFEAWSLHLMLSRGYIRPTGCQTPQG